MSEHSDHLNNAWSVNITMNIDVEEKLQYMDIAIYFYLLENKVISFLSLILVIANQNTLLPGTQ